MTTSATVQAVLDAIAADPAVDLDGITLEAQTAVVQAEQAHQASVVDYDGERPAALDDALLARVRANLEADHGAMPPNRGYRTDEVRELEHPYTSRGRRELEAAALMEAEAQAAKPARGAAKKTTAKKAAKKAPGN